MKEIFDKRLAEFNYKLLNNILKLNDYMVSKWNKEVQKYFTSWVTAVTPTDRPKSVCNTCVIKVFGGGFMLSRCFLDCSVCVGVFVTGLSQISSFFSECFTQVENSRHLIYECINVVQIWNTVSATLAFLCKLETYYTWLLLRKYSKFEH